jgi:hypothetical protein
MDVTLASEYWGQGAAGQLNTSEVSRYYIFRSVHIHIQKHNTVKRPKFDILFGENIFFLQNLFRLPPLTFFGGVSKIQVYGKMK